MKYFNYFAVFCVCLLLQVEAKDFSGISSDDGEDIAHRAKSAFEDLEKMITEIIKVALEAISAAESAVNFLQENITKLAKEAIDQLGNEIFKELDELKKEADIIGVDIIDCTEDREADIKQLFVTFLNETGFCGAKRIDEVFDSFSDIVKDFEGANDLLKILAQKLDDCKHEKHEEVCIAKVLEEITQAASKVPPKVMEDVHKSEKKIDELENYLFECYHDNYNKLEITSVEIFNGIEDCVKGKLKP